MKTEFISQAVVPKNIYLGDKVELRYTFSCDTQLLSGASNYKFDLSKVLFKLETVEYSIEQISLSQNGNNCSLAILFQPWVTGDINFPPFELENEIALQNDLSHASPAACMIFFEPVEVLKLTENSSTAIRGVGAPLLVPGTMYFVYGFAAFSLVLLIVVVVLLVHFNKLKSAWNNYLIQRKFKRNYKETVKNLKALIYGKQNVSLSDKDFCASLESTIRKYLSVKYDFLFESVVTSKIFSSLMDLTAGTLSEKKTVGAESIVEVFYRADHVRYAENTDVYVPLKSGERDELVQKSLDAVSAFEESADA